MSNTTSGPGYAPVAASAYPAADVAPARRSSWGPILAGALVAVAVGAMLNILGLAVGATAVDAVERSTPSASTFGIAASAWLLVSNLIGLVVGAYTAARLSGTTDKRDAALYGLATWAAAYLVTAVLLGNVIAGVGNAAGSVVSGVASAVGGAASTATRAAGNAVGANGGVNTDALVQRARLALSGPSDPARMTTEQRGTEIASLIGRRVADGRLSDGDRRRLSALVSAEAGIPQQEADARIQAYEQDAQRVAAETEQRAREAANAAATGAAAGAFWIFAGLLLGAIAAVLGARGGAREDVYGSRYA